MAIQEIESVNGIERDSINEWIRKRFNKYIEIQNESTNKWKRKGSNQLINGNERDS